MKSLAWSRREPRGGFEHTVGHAQRGDRRHEDREARVPEAERREPQAKCLENRCFTLFFQCFVSLFFGFRALFGQPHAVQVGADAVEDAEAVDVNVSEASVDAIYDFSTPKKACKRLAKACPCRFCINSYYSFLRCLRMYSTARGAGPDGHLQSGFEARGRRAIHRLLPQSLRL